MRYKELPEDFQVTEKTSRQVASGRFSLYRLTKCNIGTLEAIDAVSRRLQIHRRDIAFGGLKDRRAVTTQFMTILGNAPPRVDGENWSIERIGTTSHPFQTSDIEANEFTVRLRHLSTDDTVRISSAATHIERVGVPHYFDDQRFGSVSDAGEFPAVPWCRGDWEGVIWLITTAPNRHDSRRTAADKHAIRQRWRNWRDLTALITDPELALVMRYLAHRPTDFRGAITVVSQEKRSLLLNAFQSALWNLMLDEWVGTNIPVSNQLSLPGEFVPLHAARHLSSSMHQQVVTLQLPLPTARSPAPAGPMRDLMESAAHKFGLSVRELRVKYPRDSFFSKGNRDGWLFPSRLSTYVEDDARHEGHKAVVLQFTLPRGGYASLVIKWLAAFVGIPVTDQAD